MFLAKKLNKGAGSPAAPADAQFNYVTMLLHGDGTNGAQNNTFLDSSTNNFTITRNGNTTQGSFSPYGSNWSNYFDGSGDYLLFADNAGLEIGTNSFTLEAWIYLTAYSPAYGGSEYVSTVGAKEGTNGSVSYRLVIVGTASSYTALHLQIYSSDSTAVTTSASYTFALNTWYHVAAVRNGTTATLYVNGTSIGSGTNATNSQNTSAPFRVGSIGYTNFEYYFPGYISNLRLVNGTAVYTSNFTPPTAPLTAITNTGILTCQSNRFIDNSTNNAAVTVYGNSSVQRFNPFGTSTAYSTSVIGGSGYFDGTGDNLSFASGTGFDVRTGDFTIECWVNPRSTSQSGVVGNLTNSNGLVQWQIFINYTPQNKQVIFLYGTSASYTNNVIIGGNTGTLSSNSWYHIAVTRSGTTIKMFLNGAVVATDTTGNSFYNNNPNSFVIGSHADSSEFTNGYITDVRVIQGTALYTSAFTPPTAPLTAVSGTSVLTNMTNGAIYDNAMMNDLETVGNAQISTSVVKYGTGSLAFDGTGDSLVGPSNVNYAFGTGDFTVEGWFYQTADNTYPTAFEVGNHISSTGIIFITKYLGNATIYSGAFYATQATTLNAWNHIAWVRSSGVLTIYVNGVGGTGVAFTNNLTNSSWTVVGSTKSVGEAGYLYTGYIDDLRITKGYARYTANFTPPTAPFSNTGPI